MRSDPKVRAELLAQCTFPDPGTPIDCAVSGGPDSLALLVLATAAGCLVTAWHVDHALRAGSAAESQLVANAAERFGAAFRALSAPVEGGPNLEARARSARYRALPPGVATGHTADDQAETVLLALLRGSGLDGLAGMRPGREHPLLGLRRSDTLALCAAEGLEPFVDPSNGDPSFRRNRVRAELLPLAADVAQRDVVPVIARSAATLRRDADSLDALCEGLDPTDVAALCAAPEVLARRVLRRWAASAAGGHPPDAAALERLLAVVRGEQRACEIAGVGRVARTDGRLRIQVD